MQQVTQIGGNSATKLSFKTKLPLSLILGNEEKKINNDNAAKPSQEKSLGALKKPISQAEQNLQIGEEILDEGDIFSSHG